MAGAALEMNLTVQWCYATPTDILASLEMPAVTNFRCAPLPGTRSAPSIIPSQSGVLSLAFHCLSLAFHCLSLAFH